MAYLAYERELKNIVLEGKELPWVKTAKHLGCRLDENHCGLRSDLMEKRAIYINKVNEIEQEFHFAHPLTKVKINNIFNSYIYGSVMWDLFGKEAERLEKTWNISQRIMLGIPRNSHRYFIEPLTDTRHITHSLYKRYLQFINNIKSSKKPSLKKMLDVVKSDCRSNTGRNLRKLMKRLGKSTIDDVSREDLRKLTYNEVPTGDTWKINMAQEILELKNGNMMVNNLSSDEIDEILLHIVT